MKKIVQQLKIFGLSQYQLLPLIVRRNHYYKFLIMQPAMVSAPHTFICLFLITVYTFSCILFSSTFYNNLHVYKIVTIALRKVMPMFFNNLQKKLFLFFVLVELKFCIRATPSSALSFTQAKLLNLIQLAFGSLFTRAVPNIRIRFASDRIVLRIVYSYSAE